jgi:AraC family transcriptional regulator of adaptative response / DNA-3-methyladenine glycosylase II
VLDNSLPLEELVESVTAIDGLGAWTAHYLALRAGEPDAFPATDLGIRRALDREAQGSRAAITALVERWRPWRALAATHLWTADAPPQAVRPRAA